MGLWDWISSAGQNAYNWAGSNPLQALSLGAGAVGTGMGIWDAYRANLQQEQRRKLAESMMRMGPLAYAPNYSPSQLMAMYFRPASQFMQGQGLIDGGAFRQNLADTAQKAEADRVAMGNQIFQSRLGALGYGPTRQPTGNVAGFGSALQNIILQNRLAQMGGGIGAEKYTYRGTGGGDAGRTQAMNALDNTNWMANNPMPDAWNIDPSGMSGFRLGGDLQAGGSFRYPSEMQ